MSDIRHVLCIPLRDIYFQETSAIPVFAFQMIFIEAMQDMEYLLVSLSLSLICMLCIHFLSVKLCMHLLKRKSVTCSCLCFEHLPVLIFLLNMAGCFYEKSE